MYYFILGCCCLSLACQPRPASETDNEFFKTEEQQLADEANSANELPSLLQQLKQDAQQVLDLRTSVRTELDSLYSLPTDSLILTRIDLLEQAYLDLAAADEAFIAWNHQYSASFDSLGNIKDTANINQIKQHIQQLSTQLQSSIRKADSVSRL